MPKCRGKVLITAGSVKNSLTALQRMRDAGCEIVLATTPLPFREDWIIDQTQDVTGLVFAMEPISARVVESARRLRIIARPGVGYDNVDLTAATRQGVAVTIAAGSTEQSVAEHTLGLLLMITKRLYTAVESVQRRGWERPVGTELWRKTLAIVGFGRIGRAVAKRARGFDLRVIAVDPQPDPMAEELGVEMVSLDEALRDADVLSLHLPLTPGNENLINAAAIAKMKPGAFLLNMSRGGLLDEVALAGAVREGRLAGAAVDVMRVQGANTTSPLIGVPNILVTPHMATFTREAMERVALSVAESVVAALSGQRPPGIVNPAALHNWLPVTDQAWP